MFSSGMVRGTMAVRGIPCLEEAVGMEMGQPQLRGEQVVGWEPLRPFGHIWSEKRSLGVGSRCGEEREVDLGRSF